MKILFITCTYLGDAILTTGVLAWLVENYSEARFTIACGPSGKDLFRAVPRLERIIILKKKKWHMHWVTLWKQCIGTRWDLIVDFRNSIAYFLYAKKRATFKGSRNNLHKVIENAAILKLTPPPSPYLWIEADLVCSAKKWLPNDRPILALGPAANWLLKQWPIERFKDMINVLTKPGGLMEAATVIVIAGQHEREQVEPLLDSIPKDRCVDLVGCDLQIAAAYIKNADLYVGNDSGLMHLSAAIGTRTLGLFGPGYPDIYGPWAEHSAYVRAPWNDANNSSLNLMQDLDIPQVINSVKELLERSL